MIDRVTTVVIGTGHATAGGEISIPTARELAEVAAAAPTPLLWLRDAGAVPGPGALEALLEHAEQPAVSLPIDASGAPIDALLGRFTEADLPGIVEAAGRRCVPLRHTHLVSMLVDRGTALGVAPPDPQRFGPWAGSEWTMRLFARHRGMLVPSSRVLAGPRPAPAARHALRMARAGVWHRGETLRELHRAARSRRPGAGTA